VEALLNTGQEVVVLDNLTSGKESNLLPFQGRPGFVFLKGDVREPAACRQAMPGVDYILHQAARPSVPRSLQDPLLTHDINVNGTLTLLMAARGSGIKRVVLASSSSVYGERCPEDEPKREDMDLRPLSPYAASKAAMEHYALSFWHSFGLETVCLRYFNVFGPRQDQASPYAAVIPKFISALLAGQSPTIFGSGRQSRDFTPISQVVAANLAACQAANVAGEAFNVAMGESHNLLELMDIIQENLDCRHIEPCFAPSRAGDVGYSLADMTKSKMKLNWVKGAGFAEALSELCALALNGK
jgi:nucleoside-diphosphate-sugar epimerase